jgi:hypothetical protein
MIVVYTENYTRQSPSSGAEVTTNLVTSAPEDRDSVFLRNVGIDLQIHTAPKPKISIIT